MICNYTKKMPAKIHSSIRQMLRQRGLRATPQRLLVLQILEDVGEHLDAENIWLRGKDYDPSLSLATVYRTLHLLEENDLVSQRYFSRDHKKEYYELQKEEHYHFTCQRCGKVIEIHTPRIEQARQELAKELGLVFTHACICFEGYCSSCAQEIQHTQGEHTHVS